MKISTNQYGRLNRLINLLLFFKKMIGFFFICSKMVSKVFLICKLSFEILFCEKAVFILLIPVLNMDYHQFGFSVYFSVKKTVLYSYTNHVNTFSLVGPSVADPDDF